MIYNAIKSDIMKYDGDNMKRILYLDKKSDEINNILTKKRIP